MTCCVTKLNKCIGNTVSKVCVNTLAHFLSALYVVQQHAISASLDICHLTKQTLLV